MQDSIQVKQNFLRVQILESEQDPASFLQFLISSNPKKGQDLNQWGMQQLKAVVQVFKTTRSSSKKQQLVLVESPPKKMEIGSGEPSPPQIKGQIRAESQYGDDSTYCDYIACVTKQPAKIKSKVNIIGFEKVQGGVFERSYVVYQVQLGGSLSTVKRRYSDFVWLRDIFISLHPGYPVPPIAKKKGQVRYDDQYLTNKMYILQKFLNKIISISQLATDQVFDRFLTMEVPKQFEAYKSGLKKIKELPLRSVQTLSGRICASTQRKILDHIDSIDAYYRATQPQIKKIYKNFMDVASSFESACKTMKDVAANCNFLRNQEEKIRQDLGFAAIGQNNPLISLQRYVERYAGLLQGQAKTFRKQIYALFKYETYYKINMGQSIQSLREKQKEYQQTKLSLLKKKQRLYVQKMEKWGLKEKLTVKPSKQQAIPLMLAKETSELMMAREMLGVHCYQLYEECSRQVRDVNMMLSGQLGEFLQMQLTFFNNTSEFMLKLSQDNIKIDQNLRT